MNYKIISKERVHDGFLKIDKCSIEHETFDGVTKIIDRETLHRGDSVGALLYTDRHLILVCQFRAPSIDDHCLVGVEYGDSYPWLFEIVAGVVDKDEDPSTAIIREIKEETGITVNKNDLTNIGLFYLSPGGSSEKIHLYLARVTDIGVFNTPLDKDEDIKVFALNKTAVFKSNKLCFMDIKTQYCINKLKELEL